MSYLRTAAELAKKVRRSLKEGMAHSRGRNARISMADNGRRDQKAQRSGSVRINTVHTQSPPDDAVPWQIWRLPQAIEML